MYDVLTVFGCVHEGLGGPGFRVSRHYQLRGYLAMREERTVRALCSRGVK